MAVDIWFVLVIFLAPVFAEYAKIKGEIEKQLKWIETAGLFFLLSIGFGVLLTYTNYANYGSMLFDFLGWLFLLIGVLWAAANLLKA